MILAEYFPADTSQTVANLMVSFFVLVLTCYFVYGYHSKDVEPINFKEMDNFDIGYIRDDEPPVTVSVEYDELKDLERKVKIAKLKKQLNELNEPKQSSRSKPKAQPKPNNDLFNDCVEVVTSLGTPPRKAKAEAQIMFDRNPNIKTVHEFITEYGKR